MTLLQSWLATGCHDKLFSPLEANFREIFSAPLRKLTSRQTVTSVCAYLAAAVMDVHPLPSRLTASGFTDHSKRNQGRWLYRHTIK